MAVVSKSVSLRCPVERVFEKVVSLEDVSWRSDLSRIEVLDGGKRFVEYTKNGYPTTFTVTVLEPCKRYEFDMENGNMRGHWTGLFSSEGGGTVLAFTEDVAPKKFFMKPLIGGYLKKQQEAYVTDLKKALGE